MSPESCAGLPFADRLELVLSRVDSLFHKVKGDIPTLVDSLTLSQGVARFQLPSGFAGRAHLAQAEPTAVVAMSGGVCHNRGTLSNRRAPRRKTASMIHVIATVETQPGKRPDMLAEFRKVQPLVHAEAGCLEYGAAVDTQTPIPVQDTLRPDTVVIIEKWESLAHLQAHLQAAHMADYRVRIRDFVKGVRLQVLEPA